MRVLVTVTALLDYPGAVPTEPVSRALAHQLRRADIAVRVLSPSRPVGDWPTGVEFVAGDITRPADTPEAFDGVDRLFLAGASPATVHQALEPARAAGMTKVVDLSSHGPEFDGRRVEVAGRPVSAIERAEDRRAATAAAPGAVEQALGLRSLRC